MASCIVSVCLSLAPVLCWSISHFMLNFYWLVSWHRPQQQSDCKTAIPNFWHCQNFLIFYLCSLDCDYDRPWNCFKAWPLFKSKDQRYCHVSSAMVIFLLRWMCKNDSKISHIHMLSSGNDGNIAHMLSQFILSSIQLYFITSHPIVKASKIIKFKLMERRNPETNKKNYRKWQAVINTFAVFYTHKKVQCIRFSSI